MEKVNWYSHSYRRSLVDIQIEDWDKEFLSKFDAKKYIEIIKTADIQTAMIYANSHVGLCNWPTKTGKMHKNLKGRDILGELLEQCQKQNFTTVIYYSSIYNNWAYDNYPLWRMTDIEGGNSRDEGKKPISTNRYGLCCPNSKDYRDFVTAQLKEIIDNYIFNGIFIDMTFWPTVCYCQSCKERYAKEVGGSIPTQIDWDDNIWIVFQEKRVEWINDYAHFITSFVKNQDSNLTVQHNYANATYSWLVGINEKMSNANDYLGGDRYNGFIDQSFVCKLYYNLTENFPFEYMSSRCEILSEHATIKSKDMLMLHTYLSLAHNAAFLFIDAIDPIGTLDKRVYKKMGSIFSESKKYEPYLGGSLAQDISIYFSFDSKISPYRCKAKALLYLGDVLNDRITHVDSVIGTVIALKEAHIPFGVISKKVIENLSAYKTIILPHVEVLDDKEIDSFTDYVKNGGTLYLSGAKILKTLGNLTGIKQIKETIENKTYMAPTKEAGSIMSQVEKKFPLPINGTQTVVRTNKDVKVLAKVVLPYTNPADGKKFASIHSDPPGIYTDYPAIIFTKYGKGKIIWTSYPIENIDNELHKNIFVNLIKKLSSSNLSFNSDAPPEVEIILSRQQENDRYILHIINLQDKTKILPIFNFTVSINIKGKSVKKVLVLPEEKELDYKIDGDYLNISIDRLDIYKMIAIPFTI